MPPLYPFRFRPLFRRYLWGGRRLATQLGKPIDQGDDYAESWEICDRGDDQTCVAAGPLAGMSLGELVRQRGDELLGRHAPQPRFPLLFKFLDCRRVLSVQVHPNDTQAARLDPPDLGKTEAWYILDAEPGSELFAGVKSGTDRSTFERALAAGAVETCLHRFQPAVGDCVFLPAGVVHALGAGLLVAEIQQASDTTYRLHDWNRTGPDGQPRALHVEQALEVIDFQHGPVLPQSPRPAGDPHAEQLVACDKFVLERWQLSAPQAIGGDNRCRLVAVVDGAVSVEGDPVGEPLTRGHTLLLPAAVGPSHLTPRPAATLLVAYLPDESPAA